jgi:hypothetical protein
MAFHLADRIWSPVCSGQLVGQQVQACFHALRARLQAEITDVRPIARPGAAAGI